MGNRSSKSSLRSAIIYLNISADEISINDDKFWSQIFSEELATADEVVRNITVQEVRMLRDGAPRNFASLAYKTVELLRLATGTLCNTQGQQNAVLVATKILVRMLPCVFEDPSWRRFFEENSIGQPGDSPRLKYPEKRQSERNYTAYVPLKSGSRSSTPIDKLSREISPKRLAAGDQNGLIEPLDGQQPLLADIECGEPLESQPKRQIKPDECEQTPGANSLMSTLVLSICDLLFCPEFTVLSHGDSYLANAVDSPPEDLKSLSTHDYVWEPGVGFDSNVNSTTHYDKNRWELLRALLACLSETLYETPERSIGQRNIWMDVFVSQDNRHALPLFTSLLNVVFGYKQSGPMMQLNNLLSENNRGRLVEVACHLLIAALDHGAECSGQPDEGKQNAFVEYMSRIHREEDLVFLIRGFIRLLKGNLEQSHSIWTSAKSVELDQELQMLLWKMCNLNKKFVQFLLKSNDFLDVVVPILYHLNENFQEPSKTALIHLGVFNLLLLSGERNFGVRLNKQYTCNLLGNLPDFAGTHADLTILVFHKLIMYGYKISQLYHYLLTILVNVSPYLKGTTILASKCLIQLFETFSSVFVLFTEPNYHQLLVFLLEIFNNLVQYQFDGNVNMVYTILNKKDAFLSLANMPTTQKSIDKVLKRLAKQKQRLEQSASGTEAAGEDKSSASASNPPGEPDKNGMNGEQPDSSSLATVSSGLEPKSSKGGSLKQEVSLVATPDLERTTQPVHPFGLPAGDGPGGAAPQRSAPAEEPSISLDDILSGPDVPGSPAGPTRLATSDNQAAAPPLAESGELISVFDDHLSPGARVNPFDSGDRGDKPAPSRQHSQRSSESGSSSTSAGQHAPRWAPTSGWLAEWKRNLPLETIQRMISALEPQLDQLRANRGRPPDEAEVIKFLQNGTLVGLLPVPHPIQIRKYRTNDGSTMWLRACAWGIVYVRSTIWTGTDIRLIRIL